MAGTPVAGLILIRPRVEFKPIEGDALDADPDLGDAAADLGVEAVSIHTQVVGRIPEADEPREHGGFCVAGFHVCAALPDGVGQQWITPLLSKRFVVAVDRVPRALAAHLVRERPQTVRCR